MANLQDGGGKHKPRRQRRVSTSVGHDWDGPHEPILDSPPRRARPEDTRDIQKPDGRAPEPSSSSSSRRRTRRATVDMRVNEGLPVALTRSATLPHGKDAAIFNDAGGEGDRRRRTRRRRSRSSSKSRSPDHGPIASASRTPRPAFVQRSGSDSRRSSRSSSGRREPSIESASSLSGDDRRAGRRRKERDEIVVFPASPPHVPEPPTGSEARKHRRRKEEKERHNGSGRHSRPSRVEPTHEAAAASPRLRHRDHSDSPRGSHRRHGNVDRHVEVKPASSAERGSKKYYDSVGSARGMPSVQRSHTTSGSHVTSSQSVSSSSRRSSNFMNNIFGPAPPVVEKPPKMVSCLICMDELPSHKAPKLKCGHRMCNHCLKKSFRLSITDPSHMPPKCCGEDHIPLKYVDRLFDTQFKKTWNRKFAEYSTRNRIYCPSRQCGEWIQPDRIRRVEGGRKMAKCGSCKTEVCCQCNGKWHRSRDCPKDEEIDNILQKAKEEGWQRCYQCRAVVELKEGCNHMTCRCGAQFCMICGVKWKSCDCPWFSYETAEQDRLNDMQVPIHVRLDPDRGGSGGSASSPRERRAAPPGYGGVRPRPRTYEEEVAVRRLQEQRDEDFARRLQLDDDDDDDEDFNAGLVDIVGIGNAAGHHLNDDYRRAPPPHMSPPAPPPAPAIPAFERANTGDYVLGVSKARGFRGDSMERRLADRFSEQRHGTSPTHRPFGHPHPIPPPPVPLQVMGQMPPGAPLPPAHAPFGPGPRRHTMEEDAHSTPRNMWGPDRSASWGIRGAFEPEPVIPFPDGRRRHREREYEPENGGSGPKDSTLAGLNGHGRGMDRVYEWSTHVPPGQPEMNHAAA